MNIMKQLPAHIVARRDHAGQRLLSLLDDSLLLCFNDKLKRWEVWNFTWDSLGMHYGFITRLLADDKTGGYAEPGEWMVQRLRARDSRYAGADEAWKNVKAELDASEKRETIEKERREREIMTNAAEELAYDYRHEFQDLADPHWNTRQRKEWDPEPVQFSMSPRPMREQIREIGMGAK